MQLTLEKRVYYKTEKVVSLSLFIELDNNIKDRFNLYMLNNTLRNTIEECNNVISIDEKIDCHSVVKEVLQQILLLDLDEAIIFNMLKYVIDIYLEFRNIETNYKRELK